MSNSEISWGSTCELIFVVVASVLAGFIAKLPEVIPVGTEFFYCRDVSFAVFPILMFYFIWKNKMQTRGIVLISVVTLAALLFINVLPGDIDSSDTLALSCIHLPVFLWCVLGFSFVGGKLSDLPKRIEFLKYNGNLIVMTSLILMAGVLLSGMTFQLFHFTGFKIEQFYTNYVAVCGLAASPVVGTYLVQNNPQLVNKVSPVIARIFSPLVLATLVIYLAAMIFSDKSLYYDRDFLLVFNFLLIGVMAIILFSVAEVSQTTRNKTEIVILFLLSIAALIVSGMALSAILFRTLNWGWTLTPNRFAVSGWNVLFLVHLLIVAFKLFKTVRNPAELNSVRSSIAAFLPVYGLWAFVVTFVFPLIFNFR
jgi:hypothetical protein